MKPIYDSVRKAIEEVAKAHGITSVVNANAMVYGGMDLTNEVMAKVSGAKK